MEKRTLSRGTIRNRLTLSIVLVLLAVWAAPADLSAAAPAGLKALIVTGQAGHDWATSSAALKRILEESGLFSVELAVSPPAGSSLKRFKPRFASYELVVLDYNGDDWPAGTRQAFADYVRAGGGVIVFHEAGCAFPGWKDYGAIAGLAGGARGESSGPYVYWKDGEAAAEKGEGLAGYRGGPKTTVVTLRDAVHPVTRSLPGRWMHAEDAPILLLRGDPKKIRILATAFQASTGRDEPVFLTSAFGRGRIFHTTLGYVKEGTPPLALECAGTITVLKRAAEWAATGDVSQAVPADFPVLLRENGTPDDVRLWKDFRPPSLGAILEKLAGYEDSIHSEVRGELRDLVRSVQNSKDGRAACERALADFLGKETTGDARTAVCLALREIGTALSVPVLETMLFDEGTSDQARYALEGIPDAEAEKALRDALGRTSGRIRLGIINSIGGKRSKEAIPALRALLEEKDPAASGAAVEALGSIGGAAAADALTAVMETADPEFRGSAASALLRCAGTFEEEGNPGAALALYERLLAPGLPASMRLAAFRGKISASGDSGRDVILAALSGKEADLVEPAAAAAQKFQDLAFSKQLCLLLPGLPEKVQAILLAAISSSPSPEAKDAALRFLQSGNPDLRIGALRILKSAGDESCVNLLASHAAKSAGAEQVEARQSLAGLPGKGTDRAILSSLLKTADPAAKGELLMAVGERRIVEGREFLFDMVVSADPKTRRAAVKALREAAGQEDIPRLLEILLGTADEAEQEEVGAMAATVIKKLPAEGRARPVLRILEEREAPADRRMLIFLLGLIGEDRGLPAVREALASPDETLKDAAVRALAGWPTPAARHDLLRIARESASLTHRVLAMQGFIRMVGFERYIAPQAAVASLAEAAALAERREEKSAVLSILPRFVCPEALALAESFKGDEAIKAEAELATEEIRQALQRKSKEGEA